MGKVLYNKNSKNVKKADIANRYINSGYNITLEFTVDSDVYSITVNRRATLKCKLTKNGEDISSHTASNTYKTLNEILNFEREYKKFMKHFYEYMGLNPDDYDKRYTNHIKKLSMVNKKK